MKHSTSLLLSTLVISTVVFESAFAASKTQAAQKKRGSDQMKITLVKAKNVHAPIKKTTTDLKTVTPVISSNKVALENKSPLVLSTKSSPKVAATNTTKSLPAASTIVPTMAPTTSEKSTTTASSTEKSSFVTFNVSTGIGYSLGAEAPKDGKQAQTSIYDIWPSVTIGPVKTTGLFRYNQDLNENKNSDFDDPQFVFSKSKPFEAGQLLTISPAAFVVVPVSRNSKDVALLKYSAGFNSTFGLNTKNLGWDGVVLNYQPGYLKSENEFATTADGKPLTSYRIRQRANFWYPISSSFTFKSRIQFDSNFSYENVVRNGFLHFEQVDFAFAKKYSVYLGHTNSGATMQGENYENNVKFYDGESSSFYLGLWADF